MSELRSFLTAREERISAAWTKRMRATLPDGGGSFPSAVGDRFRNPMGAIMQGGAEGVTRALLAGASREELSHRIDELIHLRAVQGLPPSRALAFIPELKDVIRKEVGEREFPAGELAELDRAVDDLLFLSFDVYLRCREQIFELRARSMRDRSYKLMERAGFLWEEEPKQDSGMNRGEP